jgi:uncharacterized protein
MIGSRKIRDPIHTFVHLQDRECRIVDTSIFQRLRSIRQLAMANLVYPGAVHSRFDHTLGVFAVASEMCRVLNIDPNYVPIIRFAALLHDLGHGPFSHVSETVLDRLSESDVATEAGQKDKIHELITQQIILENSELKELSDPERQRVATLLKSGLDDPVYRQIVSGPIDADKQDYLLRDSYFCGVNYGVFDLHQLHECMIVKEEDRQKVLMIERNGLHALEQFVLAKYYLTTQVYRHKGRLITDAMLVRALEIGVRRDGIQFLKDLYTYVPKSKEYLDNYLAWDDQRILVELLSEANKEKVAAQVFRRLVDRKLFKTVTTFSLRELLSDVAVTDFEKIFPPIREELESAIAEELKREGLVSENRPEFVIAHYYRIENVRRQAANSEKAIRICTDDGVADFDEVSILFESIDKKLREEHLAIFAPVLFDSNKNKKSANQHFTDFTLDFLRRKLSPQQELPIVC